MGKAVYVILLVQIKSMRLVVHQLCLEFHLISHGLQPSHKTNTAYRTCLTSKITLIDRQFPLEIPLEFLWKIRDFFNFCAFGLSSLA